MPTAAEWKIWNQRPQAKILDIRTTSEVVVRCPEEFGACLCFLPTEANGEFEISLKLANVGSRDEEVVLLMPNRLPKSIRPKELAVSVELLMRDYAGIRVELACGYFIAAYLAAKKETTILFVERQGSQIQFHLHIDDDFVTTARMDLNRLRDFFRLAEKR
ncbi:hypothetical protein KW786_03080 [Candidatus Parcubacteria bacterium]|nr:hypothetical protein [Candidatus Parcubacteria bacterium]